MPALMKPPHLPEEPIPALTTCSSADLTDCVVLDRQFGCSRLRRSLARLRFFDEQEVPHLRRTANEAGE